MKYFVASVGVLMTIWIFLTSLIAQNSSAVQMQLNLTAYETASGFVEVVTDKASLNQTDFRDLVKNLAETGIIYDITITIKKRIVYANKVEYIADSVITKDYVNKTFNAIKLNSGDKVVLELDKQSKSNSERLLEVVTGGLNNSTKKFNYVGMVR